MEQKEWYVMVKKCWKCGTKKDITRHHVFGKEELCGLKHDSSLPLIVLLLWVKRDCDMLDLMYWEHDIVPLCRKCHDKFHILFTKIARSNKDIDENKIFKLLETNHA